MEYFPHSWYEAERARSGRSKCKEFRCKEVIGEGELRIGIKTEEHDHGGDSLGWYHPNCLWKTFSYKSNANPRIAKASDIKNFRSLDEEDKEVFKRLISKSAKASEALTSPTKPTEVGVKRNHEDSEQGSSFRNLLNWALPSTTSSSAEPPGPGCVSLSLSNNNQFEVSGDTYNVREILKAAGGRWNGASKRWVYPVGANETVLALFDLSSPPPEGQTVSATVSQLLTAAGNGGSKASATATAGSKYAMAGTIVFKLVTNTQDILIRGDIGHISDRLRAAGGVLKNGQYTLSDFWMFSTQSRAGARKFLCMPDDLPPPETDLEIDLEELGRKQAALDGVVITAADQQGAEALLHAEKERQDAQLLQDAREGLSTLLGWGREEGASATGRPKRAKKEESTSEVGVILHPLPTSVAELCYESRLDLSKFTVDQFKSRLAARGLPTSGNRATVEARFLRAGAEFAPILDFEEYSRLAKEYRYALRGVLPTRADALIDELLGKCNKPL